MSEGTKELENYYKRMIAEAFEIEKCREKIKSLYGVEGLGKIEESLADRKGIEDEFMKEAEKRQNILLKILNKLTKEAKND